MCGPCELDLALDVGSAANLWRVPPRVRCEVELAEAEVDLAAAEVDLVEEGEELAVCLQRISRVVHRLTEG